MDASSQCRRIGLAVALLAGTTANAANVPPGFSDSTFEDGFTAPTAMEFAPDGRLFVLEQGGAVRVV